jgi:hypothetical protein
MGKRGPQPVNLALLTVWECEFYKAFHFLRDGIPLPRNTPTLPHGLSRGEMQAFINRLRQMSAQEYWLTDRRLLVEVGHKANLAKPPTFVDLQWAEGQRLGEIRGLERMLTPFKIEAEITRRKIWTQLVNSDTYAVLRKACGRWAQLQDVRRSGLTCFPSHVIEHAGQFLAMKKNNRFPHSSYADKARIDYLARGMAGVIVGVSPMTGIERLRNMRHDRSGPLWDPRNNCCSCWRCSLPVSRDIEAIGQDGYDNGLRLFMQLAETTKVPQHWKKRDAMVRQHQTRP